VGMPVVIGVGAFASNVGAMTPAFPAGYTAVADDVALTWRETENADTPSVPSGWTLAANQGVASGTTTRLSIISKRLVAGDTAPSLADVGDHQVGIMMIIRGCKTTGNPWNATPTAGQELVADTTVAISGVTTTVNDCLCLYGFSTGQSVNSGIGATGWANASLTDVLEQMDRWATAGTGGGFAMASGGLATFGASGTMTATLSLTANFKAQICIAMEGAPTPWLPRRTAHPDMRR